MRRARSFLSLAVLIAMAAGARAAEDVCTGEEGACKTSSTEAWPCDLDEYTMDSLSEEQLASIIKTGKPFILKGGLEVSKGDITSKEGFFHKFGQLEVVPRLGLEIMVDGRISKDDASRPRPSVSISGYLEHLSRDADGIEKVLYGQVLSEEELLARDETLKKHKKIAPDSPLRQVSVDVSDLEALQSEGLKALKSATTSTPLDTPMLYLAHKGSGSPFQTHGDSWHGAVLGQTTMYIYPTKTGVPSEVASQFILSEVDGDYLKILSKDRGERPLICEQGPGDVIFVPEYWPYARISTSDAVVFSKHARHTPIQPQKTDRLEEFKELSEKYPNVHQFHVDIALSLIKENPKDCIKHMEMALEVGKYNMALRWQVARLLSRIGAKGPALSIASESIKLLTEASGAQSLTAKEKEADDEEKEGGEEEEDGGALFGEVSASIAKIHWSKFGQLLLYDLNMPLEAIVCFQVKSMLAVFSHSCRCCCRCN